MALGAAAAAGCPAPPRSCLPALRGDGIQSWFGVEGRGLRIVTHVLPQPRSLKSSSRAKVLSRSTRSAKGGL